MVEEKLTIGKRLGMLRQQNSMTQEMLADKLSISRQSVSKWETDAAIPDLEKMIMLADIYQVSIDYLVRGEPAAKPEEQSLGSKVKKEKPTGAWMQIALLISALFGLISLLFAVNIWSHFALFSNESEQDIMTVTKIYEQYTKAQVQGVDKSGRPYSKILWLDRQGVAENDLLWAYAGDSAFIRVPYYNKTVLLPLLYATLFWLLFLMCFWKVRKEALAKKDIACAAGISLLFAAVFLAMPVTSVLLKNKTVEKTGSRKAGQIMQQETADPVASVPADKKQRFPDAEKDTFALEGFDLSLKLPLIQDFYVQGSYLGEDYHSVQLYNRKGSAWINCNLHKSNDFYKNASDYMMIQMKNAKDWEEKWTGKELELKTVTLDGRVCYFYEAHYKYDDSDIQKVLAVCDVDASHFLEVDCEGLDHDGVLNFEQIKGLFYFQ